MIKAIIFDCFGVIISDALQVLCNELHSRNPAAAIEVRDLVRASNRGLLDPQQSSRQIARIFGVELGEYQRQIRDGEVKDARLLAYIRDLRGSYKTAMLSNISSTGLARRFTAQELSECFDTVVASGEIGYAKPEPEAYEIVAERLGVRLDECIFTDDRLEFCEGARVIGMQAIEYTGFEQFQAALQTLLKQAN